MKLFQKIGNWIRNKFSNISDVIEDKAPDAVILTQTIKTAIEKHEGSIEWVLDELKLRGLSNLHDFAKRNLPVIIHELSLIDGLIPSGSSQDEAWKAYTGHIASKMKNARVKEWVNLAATILGALLFRTKAPRSVLIMATQFAYERIFGKP
jgi:hypothetical protein